MANITLLGSHTELEALLAAMGHSVTPAGKGTAADHSFVTGADLVIIGPNYSTSPDLVGLVDVPVPIITFGWSSSGYDYLGMSDTSVNSNWTTSMHVAPASDGAGVVGGRTVAEGAIQVWTSSESNLPRPDNLHPNAVGAWNLEDFGREWAVYADAGVELHGGHVTPARRLAALTRSSGIGTLTPDGEAMIEAMVSWALGETATPADPFIESVNALNPIAVLPLQGDANDYSGNNWPVITNTGEFVQDSPDNTSWDTSLHLAAGQTLELDLSGIASDVAEAGFTMFMYMRTVDDGTNYDRPVSLYDDAKEHLLIEQYYGDWRPLLHSGESSLSVSDYDGGSWHQFAMVKGVGSDQWEIGMEDGVIFDQSNTSYNAGDQYAPISTNPILKLNSGGTLDFYIAWLVILPNPIDPTQLEDLYNKSLTAQAVAGEPEPEPEPDTIPAPSGLSAAPDPDNGTTTINAAVDAWTTAPSGAPQYVWFLDGTQVSITTTPSYSFTGLSPETSYEIGVEYGEYREE